MFANLVSPMETSIASIRKFRMDMAKIDMFGLETRELLIIFCWEIAVKHSLVFV
jgi:hypothetical protein